MPKTVKQKSPKTSKSKLTKRAAAPVVTRTIVKPLNGPPCRVERTFTHHVDVPDPTPAQTKARETACVRLDRLQHCALELSRTADAVTYIPHSELGLDVVTEPPARFDARYGTRVLDYPTGRAARLYVGFATILGGTSEAMTALANLVNVTTEEFEMATKKAATKGTKTAVSAAAKVAPKTNGTKPKTNGAQHGAAAYFRELIMKGGQPDSKIFAAVQAKYHLDDSKRSYVAWYRNQLKKQGKNPPAAVEAK